MTPRAMSFALAAVALGLAGACAGPDTEMQPQSPIDLTTTSGAPSPAPPAATPPAQPATVGDPLNGSTEGRPGLLVTDAQVVAVIEAASGGEVARAVEFLHDERGRTEPRVIALAERLLDEHEAASRELKAIETSATIVPEENAASRHLESANDEAIASLRTSQPANVDKRFAVAQVRDHRELLWLLDTTLLPKAANPQLAVYLRKFRAMVAADLLTAEEVEATLQAANPAGSAPPVR